MLRQLRIRIKDLVFGRVLIESVVVIFTEYLMLGAFVLVNFLINRYYGAEEVGIFALSYAIAQIGILGIGSSFSLLMRRDLSIAKYNSDEYVSKIQRLRVIIVLLVLVLAVTTILLFYPRLQVSLVFIILMICSKGFDTLSETYYTAYQSLNRLRDYSFFKTSNALAFIAVSVFVCVMRYEIQVLYYAQLVCAALIFGSNVLRWNRSKRSDAESETALAVPYRFLLFESYPLMVSALIFQIGLRANNLLIFDKLGEKELGKFSIVLITVGIFAGVANALAIVFFGRLSRIFADQRKVFSLRLHETLGLFLGIGVLFFVLFQGITPIIEYVFKLDVERSFYFIMSASIPFLFVVSCLGAVFTIIRRQKVGMYLTFVVLIFNLSAFYLLAGELGLLGAGYAYLISAVFQSILIYTGTLISLKYTKHNDAAVDLGEGSLDGSRI